MFIHIGFSRDAYDVGTSEERLVVAVVLTLELGPVLHLDGGIRSGSDALQPLELITLVAGIDVGDVGDDLVVKVGLGSGVCGALSASRIGNMGCWTYCLTLRV